MSSSARSITRVLTAPFDQRHYFSLLKSWQVYPSLWEDFFLRYVMLQGDYPHKCNVKTPIGIIPLTLFSPYDTFTVNEIFCWECYQSDSNVKVIVDLGSNIGISALYFLSRNNYSYCYLFEPLPANVEKLKSNLKNFQGRYCLNTLAVSDRSEVVNFTCESTGRYSGINLNIPGSQTIEVQTTDINEVLDNVISLHGNIDVLKVDIEGAEKTVIPAIRENSLKKIKFIYIEGEIDPNISPLNKYFIQVNHVRGIYKFVNPTLS